MAVSNSSAAAAAATAAAAAAAREAAARAAKEAAARAAKEAGARATKDAARAATERAQMQVAMRTMMGANADTFSAARPNTASAALTSARSKVTEVLANLEPRAEGTRVATRAFEQELASISQGLATQSLTPAAAQQRAQRVQQLAEVLVQGKDRFDTSGGGSGVTFSQSSRARLEGAGDWSLTTRMEIQDLQQHMAAGLLEGRVDWNVGLELVRDVAGSVPLEGQPQSLEQRAAMLDGLRGASAAFWGSATTPEAPAQRFKASSLGLLGDPRKALDALLPKITTEFKRSEGKDLEALAPAAFAFALSLEAAVIPPEYQPVEFAGHAAKDASWSFKNGDTDELHYFAVDVRNPTTGKTEQNVYHLDPNTGVFSQVSNLDAQGQRLQEPKSGPWTAGPATMDTVGATLEANTDALAALGVKPSTLGGRQVLLLPNDVSVQHQSDGSAKLWKTAAGKATAVSVPASAMDGVGVVGGASERTVPPTADNVRGPRVDTTLAGLEGAGFQVLQTARGPVLNLNDSTAFWVDREGRLNVQDRRGPDGLDRGNPNSPVHRLSREETARVAGANGMGWAFVLSDWNAPKSALNPRPGAGQFGFYKRGEDGQPVEG